MLARLQCKELRAVKFLAKILASALLLVVASISVIKPGFSQAPGSFSTLSTTGTATLGGDVLMCSGRPWLDVRCYGAVGDGNHDDTAAIQTAINNAIANNWPVHLAAGTYKVTSGLNIDYSGQAASGFRLISRGAIIDGRSVSTGPVIQVQCGGGSPASTSISFRENGLTG